MKISINIMDLSQRDNFAVITERISAKEGIIATQLKKNNLEMIFDENIISKDEILDFIEDMGFSIL
ncbi:hypothetical protein [Clostridium grantii]|uniref:Copper chaperone CopZ n=1 Tax=Clostridium grantii DSM 8605 TaxID=1121316 RepID=A0A1M5XRR0_9CLOT|nr:hypothetical protein [Clostridium grantii]SHI02228.1 hypothetical protein SAMN02745207_03866 [Clostridium grantii DSM 8605]